MSNEVFIASLPDEISRETVLSQIKGQLKDITDNLEPSIALALESFPKGVTFRSVIGKRVERKLVQSRLTRNRDHWMFDAAIAVENIKGTIPALIQHIEALDGSTLYKAGIDLRTVNVLQLVEANRFMLNYIPLMILWVTSAESAVAKPGVKEALSVGLRNWLTDNLGMFASLLSLYMTPADVVVKKLSTIVQIPALKIDYSAVSGSQADKLEAMRFSLLDSKGFSDILTVPIYRLMKIWAEYTVARYNERKELRSALELRLIELKMARNNETDAVLTQRIEYTENRLAKLNAQIRAFEESVDAR